MQQGGSRRRILLAQLKAAKDNRNRHPERVGGFIFWVSVPSGQFLKI